MSNWETYKQAYARIGMAKEAGEAAKDGEYRFYTPNNAASSIFDSIRDRLSFQGLS